MITLLHIKNCFKHTDTLIKFEKGFTAITGANEAGKSLIFEMITYGLFGAGALRGVTSDYKKLSVVLEFNIGGGAYSVHRTMKNAELFRDGVQLCAGTKIVNQKIPELLGYDMKVFELANYAKQNNLTSLSDMKPTERKSMVDNVIGLNVVDKMNTIISERQSAVGGVIDSIGTLSEAPVCPQAPEGYPSGYAGSGVKGTLKLRTQELQTLLQEQHTLTGWLGNILVAPEEPEYPEGLDDYDVVPVKYQQLQTASQSLREKEREAASYFPPEITLDEAEKGVAAWKEAEAHIDAQATLAKCVSRPTITKIDADTGITWWARYEEYLPRKRAFDAEPEIHCPECDHVWHEGEVVEPEVVSEPTETKSYYQEVLNQWSLYEAQRESREEAELVPDASPPEQRQSYYETQLQYAQTWEVGKDLVAEVTVLREEVESLQDYNRQYALWQQYETKYDFYETTLANFKTWETERVTKHERCEALKAMFLEQELTAVEAQLEVILDYEREFSNYEILKAQWDEKRAALTEAQTRYEGYVAAKLGLKDLRARVKKYLVPSLNKVASHLINQMTNGERQVIQIDEDFDIKVDGQPILTLSGSGKAVANLAIRIGLGQVLINKQFSVFMADEIDGDMDATRAAATATCLQRLTKNIDQLLLISHKRPEAQHYVELS